MLDPAAVFHTGFVVDGLLVELVDARRRTAFERWFAGGPFPSAQER